MDLAQAVNMLRGVAVHAIVVAGFVSLAIPVILLTAYWAFEKRHGIDQ